MQHVASAELWPLIHKLAKRGPKRAAIAYVSTDDDIKFTKGDTLVVDASDEAIKSRETSASVLKAALRRGANLYSVPGLHAKVMLLNGTGVIGSANLSSNSQRLVEAGFITDAAPVTAMLASFIERLANRAERINGAFIAKIERLPLAKPRRGPPIKGRRRRVTLGASRTWMVGSHLVAEPDEEHRKDILRFQGEADSRRQDAANEASWMTLADSSLCRRTIKAGDIIILLYRFGRRLEVEPPAPVLLRHETKGAALIFVEATKTPYRYLSLPEFRTLLGTAGGRTKFNWEGSFSLSDQVAEAALALWPKKVRRKRSAGAP